jgi:ABC-type lipoprotein export system ATPase subunit
MAMSFQADRLTFVYPREANPVLRQVSFDLRDRPDQTIAVLGPSGSGKTTLLNLLGLLWDDRPVAGRIIYRAAGADDLDYAALKRSEKNELRLREYGFVLQSCYLLPHFTCLQNILLPLQLQGWSSSASRDRAQALLRQADQAGEEDGQTREELWHVRHKLGSEVSLGQRQRMAVLRAMVHDPQVVFADEPVSNLDSGSTRRMLRLLREWRKGSWRLPGSARTARTLVLVCHHLETALREADWFLVLNSSHQLACSFGREQWQSEQGRVHSILGISDYLADRCPASPVGSPLVQ